MTFYEAAVEILRGAGRPLHYKKITALSLERDLLTHVGRSPEQTMEARLSQEVAKSSEDSLIRAVRPGVYQLREDVDPADARQTIQLREIEDADDDDDDKDDEDSKPAAKADDNDEGERKSSRSRRRRKRRRPRRDDDDQGKAKTRSSNDDDSDDGDDIDAAGDLADQVARRLADGKTISLRDIANELNKTAYQDIPSLGSTALRRALELANDRRARAGRPPIFTEVGREKWTLAAATDDDLARSYAALDRWQSQHSDLLQKRLEDLLKSRSDEQLLGIVSLVMERLGYIELDRHNPVDEELATFSASFPMGLTDEQIAVRVCTAKRRAKRADVTSFRGSLNLYQATRGILVAPGGCDKSAVEQTEVPNVAQIDIVDAEALAQLMMRTGVGLVSFSVEATCLDDAFFS